MTVRPSAGERGLDLRAERLRLGLTVPDLAERLQVHPTSVLRYERLDRAPAPGTVLALADLLDLPAYDVSRFFDRARSREDGPRGLRGWGLRPIRRRRGVSVRRLATGLGLHVATIYNWEHGRVLIPHAVVPDLAALLRIAPADLLSMLEGSPYPVSRPSAPLAPLRRLRRRAGLSQQAVAERIGYSRHSVGAWERGVRPPLHAVRLLASVYGTPVSHLAAVVGLEAPAELSPSAWRPGDLPRVLRVLRSWSGRSQHDVARLCGCSVSAVRAWEAGRHAPGPALRAALEEIHRLDAGALLGAYPEPSPGDDARVAKQDAEAQENI